jgi:hypothetical protein
MRFLTHGKPRQSSSSQTICLKHGIEYEIHEMEFDIREDVKNHGMYRSADSMYIIGEELIIMFGLYVE